VTEAERDALNVLRDVQAATVYDENATDAFVHYLSECVVGSGFYITLPLLTNMPACRAQVRRAARLAGRRIATQVSADGSTLHVLITGDNHPTKRA
jgi:hypothetical protein